MRPDTTAALLGVWGPSARETFFIGSGGTFYHRYSACNVCVWCGNGQVEPGEGCDDGNTTWGDGCNTLCQIGPECGDGQVEPGERCDDGNTTPGDGCNALCRIEPECGNGQVEPGERCDDGNTTPGDGCDAACRIEFVPETEPNEDGTPEMSGAFEGNDFSTVNANGPYEVDTIIAATLEPAGDEDVFAVTNRGPAAVSVRFDTHDAAVGWGIPCQAIDTVLFVRDFQGNVLASNDDTEFGHCSMVEHVIEPGETVYAHVLDYDDDDAIPEPGYWLAIDFQ